VVHNVLREHVDLAAGVVESELVGAREFLLAHAHELDVAEVDQAAALHDGGVVELPSADDRVYEPVGIARELPALADREVDAAVELRRVGDATLAAGIKGRDGGLTERISVRKIGSR